MEYLQSSVVFFVEPPVFNNRNVMNIELVEDIVG